MRELRDPDFRERYFVNKCKDLLDAEVKETEFIDIGLLNFVYRVGTDKGDVYFKQALEQVKYPEKVGNDLQSLPPQRIESEKNALLSLENIMPQEIRIPKVFSYDSLNNILITSDVKGDGGVLLQEALLKGDFKKDVAGNIGLFLGISHKHTYGKRNNIRKKKEDRENWELMLNARTTGIKVKDEKVLGELRRLYDSANTRHKYNVLINADCCPKNIFQRPNAGIGIVDFETASGIGDPAYDIGLATGHYLLFALLNGNNNITESAIESIAKGYLDEITSLGLEGIERRMVKYAGATILYRIAGSSPAPFIPKEKIPELIKKGSGIVMGNYKNILETFPVLRKK
ncbi:MAG: aminoglycoside phosphotransferase family protein [archaeon]